MVDVGGVEVFHWNPRRPLIPGRLGRLLPKGPAVNNFGDMMGPVIVRSLAPSDRPAAPGARLLAVGSILHFARDRDVVWGSGVNGKIALSEITTDELDVRAVRGPLTADVIRSRGVSVPSVFGDPGLLVPGILGIRRHPAPTRELLVVPNLHDWQELRRHPAAINPRAPLATIVDAIAGSAQVVSSSLHGLVIADALGIPASLLKPSKENLFKYEDYYEGTGRRLPTVNETIASALDNVADPLAWTGEELVGAFPRDLWAA